LGKKIITILDCVHCKANKYAREAILPALEYENIFWKKGRYGRSREIKKSYMITGRAGTAGNFLTGLLDRVKSYCEKSKISITILGLRNIENIEPTKNPSLKNIIFREDQKKALIAIKKNNRGKLIFPTGSGKTIIALGIFSMFPKCRILFLCHTKDLIEQTLKEIRKYFKDRDLFVIGAGYKSDWNEIRKAKNPIVLSTIQSFSRLNYKNYMAYFDVTLVDEMHHVNSLNSQYGHAMEHNLSPRRYGLTATEPTNKKEKLINEGIFGKTIASLSIIEGVKKGIVAKPKIRLIPVPIQETIKKLSGNKYKNYYEYGIVKNKKRNLLILKEVKRSINKKSSVLVIIERTEHGFILQKLFKQNGINSPFVYGDVEKDKRSEVKEKLNDKNIKCVICSKVWKEGINIPTLNHIINAAGMKEEKGVIQSIGRGLRISEGKSKIILTDFLDPYRFLAEHSIQRIQVYRRQKWI